MTFINIFIWRLYFIAKQLEKKKNAESVQNCTKKAQIGSLGNPQFCGRPRDQQWRHQLTSQLQ